MTANELIRERIFQRQRERWGRLTEESGFFRRMMRAATGPNDTEGIFITEHNAIDPETCACIGHAIGAWKLNQLGLVEVEPAEVWTGTPTRGGYWRYLQVRMFITDDNLGVFVNEINGPKRGVSLQMEPRRIQNGFELAVTRSQRPTGDFFKSWMPQTDSVGG